MITVRIDKSTLRNFGSDIHGGMHTLKTLQKAGIPVVGVLLPMGAANGVLTMTDDEFADEIVWTWDGGENMA